MGGGYLARKAAKSRLSSLALILMATSGSLKRLHARDWRPEAPPSEDGGDHGGGEMDIHLPTSKVIKASNNIYFGHLGALPTPSGDPTAAHCRSPATMPRRRRR